MTRDATSRRSEPVVRLSGPGELAAALPVLVGFVPRESLVLVCLDGLRVGLTVRCDLPDPALEDALVDDLVRRVRLSGAERTYVAVCTDEAGPAPRSRLVARLHELPAALLDVLLVRDGRWRSLLCRDDACCPPGGLPLPEQAPALTLVRAQAALQGRAVLPDRAALVTALQPPVLPSEGLAALRQAEDRLSQEVADAGRAACRRRLVQALRRALHTGRGTPELALALHDVMVRDEVLTWVLRREERLYSLLLDLARTTPAPYDAPACTCLAWVAYQRGDGAAAQVALDRALATDAEYGLARLLQQALDGQVRPRELRGVVARTAKLL